MARGTASLDLRGASCAKTFLKIIYLVPVGIYPLDSAIRPFFTWHLALILEILCWSTKGPVGSDFDLSKGPGLCLQSITGSCSWLNKPCTRHDLENGNVLQV